jgi:2-phosphosulfolactate phosphatase
VGYKLTVPNPFSQHGYRVRLEWGPGGLAALAGLSAVIVIVDVLSFSTAVDIAVGRGATVLPVPWRAPAAPDVELPAGAVPAGRRGSASWSLSPSSLLALPAGTRLALPSPNGATLSAAAAESGATVLAGCLRNAPNVAATALACLQVPPSRPGSASKSRPDDGDGVISVVPAGERWPDGDLRPAIEDMLGAGAVVAELARLGAGPCSPEALAAADAFEAARRQGLHDALAACSSGRELHAAGFGADVALAAEYGVSGGAPVLCDGEYGPFPVEGTA